MTTLTHISTTSVSVLHDIGVSSWAQCPDDVCLTQSRHIKPAVTIIIICTKHTSQVDQPIVEFYPPVFKNRVYVTHMTLS